MAIYRCMDFYLDLAKVVAVTELEQTAVFRRFGVFIGNNAQNLIFKGQHQSEGWVRVANHHKWLMDSWNGYQCEKRSWSWSGTRYDVELIHRLRNFNISLLGITAVGGIESGSFPVYLYGRNDPLVVSSPASAADHLQADHDALITAWKSVVPPIVGSHGHPDSVQTADQNPVSSERPF